MVDKPEGHRQRVALQAFETIDLSISDEDITSAPPAVREVTANASHKRKHLDSASRPKGAHKKDRAMAIKKVAAVSTVDLTSNHSGSQISLLRSQQQSLRANSTLASRTAIRTPESRGASIGRQPQRVISSSSHRASSPPASQVQIIREPKATNSIYSQHNPARGSLGASGKSSQRKRSVERDGKIEQPPTAKKHKSSQGNGQSSSEPVAARAYPKKPVFPGTGKDSNPIVISDSPPPEENPARSESQSISSGAQKTPKQSRAYGFKGARKAPAASSFRSKSASAFHHVETRREILNDDSVAERSPTIPESLPDSPEVNKAAAGIRPLHPELPLFGRPSDNDTRESMSNEKESFSSLADELLIDSGDFGTPTQRRNPGAIGTGPTAPLSAEQDLGHVKVMDSPTKKTISAIVEAHMGRVDVAVGHSTTFAPPTARLVAQILPDSQPRNEISKDMTTADDIEKVINKYMQELRDDNMYWTRTWLKRARHMVPAQTQRPAHELTSVFRDMKPLELVQAPEGNRITDLLAKLTMETFNGGSKSSKRSYSVPCTMYHTPTDADVPNYSHFVNIKHSFLSQNETVLRHWPYFGDDFEIDAAPELEQHYYMDVTSRDRKIKRLAQAENFAEYVEDMLRDVGCTWSDVLRFLLDPKPNVGASPEALAALRNRDKFCKEDFIRGGQRWTTVLSKLPLSSDPGKVGKAALLCEYFQKIAKFPLWHVARRSDFTTSLLRDEDPKLDLNEITCRICMRFNCPYHGEIHETRCDSSESERDGSVDGDVVETDIIHPYRVNYRSRVKFPPSVDTEESGAENDPKSKKVEYWHKRNLNHYPDDRRGPFYPCYHPGTTCEKIQCSCFVDRIPCEKSCACPPSCKRTWQGCDCRKKGGPTMICFEDPRCACFQLGRECDADLCGDCGVADVLDPFNRHDDETLRGRCHNASIQRGVPRHTILGDSGIHGLGLYACEDIETHDFVGEYKGEVITKAEAERRGSVYEHQKLSYLFTLNKKQEVDSSVFGNKVRFINHASDKQSNLYPRIIMVNTIFRIALYGKRKIKAGQELLFDYGDQFPQDQLGGTANKERKAAPHLRNKNLVKDFDEVVEETDKYGNRRARKAAGGSKRGKASSRGFVAASTEAGAGECSFIARDSSRPPFNQGGAHSGAGRPRRDRAAGQEGIEDALRRSSLDDMDRDPGHRLGSYNVAPDDGDEVYFHRDQDKEEDDDDDFTPQGDRSSDD